MKKIITTCSFVCALALIFKSSLLQSNINQPPVGATGAPPINTTCAQGGMCHVGPAVADNAMFTLRLAENEADLINFASIVSDSSNSTYIPGQTYFGSLELSSGASVYGFEMLALNTSNNQAGAFTITDPTHTSLQTIGGKSYLGHKNANSTRTFNFQWVAPTNAETVTFYYAGNFANGNGNSSGDDIYTGAVSVSAEVLGVEDIASVQQFQVYPTQTMSNVSVKFHSKTVQYAQLAIYDMSGKVVKILREGSLASGENEFLFDVSELSRGNYLLSLKAGNTEVAKHVVKL